MFTSQSFWYWTYIVRTHIFHGPIRRTGVQICKKRNWIYFRRCALIPKLALYRDLQVVDLSGSFPFQVVYLYIFSRLLSTWIVWQHDPRNVLQKLSCEKRLKLAHLHINVKSLKRKCIIFISADETCSHCYGDIVGSWTYKSCLWIRKIPTKDETK